MASIPLPALDVKPPAPQQDPVEQYGRLLQLKNAMQEQPLRMQIMQQQAQTGDLQLQQQQIALNDQKAMTSAMQQWDGKDLNQLAPLVLKNGGSSQAVIGLKQKALGMQQTFSKIAADDATTGSKNLETLKGKNDMVAGALGTVLQMPDNQLAQGLSQTAQQLAQQGLIDPQHAQIALQMAQAGDPAQIRQQLSLMQKGMMSQSQLMDAAQKQAQIGEAQSTTAKNSAEAGWYAKNGGAPGVSVDAVQQADWLQKHPGKGPSDYKLWVMQNSPMARIATTNMFGGPQNQDALDFAANNYRQTGQIPPDLSRSPQTVTAIISRAAQLDKQMGGSGVAGNKAYLQANRNSLEGLQKNFDQVQAFEQTASKNMDLLQQTAKGIPDLGSRFANVPVRMLNSKMLGTDKMAAFNTALNTAQTEAAKVLNSSNGSGVLSDSARHELQDIIDGNMSYSAMVASMNTLKQDMANRTQAYQSQIQDIQGRIKASGSGQPTTIPAPQGQTLGTTAKPDGVYEMNGRHFRVKGGQVYAAD